MPEIWYCCRCSYGPHIKSLYDYCVSCGELRCSYCPIEKAYDNASPNVLDALPYPHTTMPSKRITKPDNFGKMTAKAPCVAASSYQLCQLTPNVQNVCRSRAAIASSLLHGNTQHVYLWVCHVCGDGPKVWDNEQRCVNCDHNACSECQMLK